MYNLLDIATPTNNGIGGTDLTIAIIGVAAVVVIGVIALVMAKGKNGK